MKIYQGTINNGKAYVTVQTSEAADPVPLKHLVKHTPMGFNWGVNGGSGASDLAWSILIDLLGGESVDFIEFIYQKFKKEIIFNLEDTEWSLSSDIIQESIKDYKQWFDSEYEKKVTLNCPVNKNLSLSATGNVEMLIKLSNEIKALTSANSLDLTGTFFGQMYYSIMDHCETIKDNLENKIAGNQS